MHNSGKNIPREWEKAAVIEELRHIYKLTDLLAFVSKTEMFYGHAFKSILSCDNIKHTLNYLLA